MKKFLHRPKKDNEYSPDYTPTHSISRSATLETEWKKYSDFVDSYAATIFYTKIAPWLDQHNYNFIAGNGTYFIHPRDETKPRVDTDKLPQYISKWLEMEIPGMPYNSLGTIMPNYEK